MGGILMDKQKRKLYQVRGHLLKSEVILKELQAADRGANTHPFLARSLFSVKDARRRLYDYIFSKWGGIDPTLKGYK